jgi:hypothetical protein
VGLVAQVAIATSISPNELLEAPPEIFWAMVQVLNEQQQELERARGRR